jgi:hypothetical protein
VQSRFNGERIFLSKSSLETIEHSCAKERKEEARVKKFLKRKGGQEGKERREGKKKGH